APCFTDGNLISAAQQFYTDYVFKDLIDVTLVISVDCLSDSMIGQVDLFLSRKYGFSYEVLPPHQVQKACCLTILDVVVDRFSGDSTMAVLQVFDEGSSRECISLIGDEELY